MASQQRESFNKAITFIKREGLNEFINWLETESDFFTAPASTIYHSNYEGGLLDHSLYVTKFALHNFNFIVKEKPEYEYLRESVVLCGLFHDIAKCNTYVPIEKWYKDSENKWKSYQGYESKTQFPYPHGPKSVYLISKFMKLTDAEAMAVAFHMGSTDLYQPESLTKTDYNQAMQHPLVKIIHTADILAMALEETKNFKV